MAIEKVSLNEQDPDFQQGLYELNLQRAIQACIDIANTILAKEGLGLPNAYRQSFELLTKHGVLSDALGKKMISMVGFRNISVHDYQTIKPAIVTSIVKNHLKDFEDFYSCVYDRVMKTWK